MSGLIGVYIGDILCIIYRDNGKEHGSYYFGFLGFRGRMLGVWGGGFIVITLGLGRSILPLKFRAVSIF